MGVSTSAIGNTTFARQAVKPSAFASTPTLGVTNPNTQNDDKLSSIMMVQCESKGKAKTESGTTPLFPPKNPYADEIIGSTQSGLTTEELKKRFDAAKVQDPEEIERLTNLTKEWAREEYEKDLISKKLIYVPEQKGSLKKTPARYTYIIDKEGEFLWKIKQRYLLPDGVFADRVKDFPGDRDLYKTYGSLDIPADVLEKSIGLNNKK